MDNQKQFLARKDPERVGTLADQVQSLRESVCNSASVESRQETVTNIASSLNLGMSDYIQAVIGLNGHGCESFVG